MKYAFWAALVEALAAGAGAAPGQCTPEWLGGAGAGDPDDDVRAFAVFDDRTGPALFVGGGFRMVGGLQCNSVAKWDGTAWSALGGGVDYRCVNALAVFDDGTGPALYVGGYFDAAGGVSCSNIAKWNGTTWSPLGSGTNGMVITLLASDDGGGPTLYAGGHFTTAGGVPCANVAQWRNGAWSPLGGGVSGNVRALIVFDDGISPALYAGGGFATADGVPCGHLAKWDGSAWSSVGGGVAGRYPDVASFAVFDDGTGPLLIVGGCFTTAGGVGCVNIAQWDGIAWSPLGSGITAPTFANPTVEALRVCTSGNGPTLYAGGWFTSADGTTCNYIARWDGASWSALGSGLSGCFGSGCTPMVRALEVLDIGNGPALYVGGDFTAANGMPRTCIARWGCPPKIGDLNCDGTVSFQDVNPFVVYLSSPSTWQALFPGCPPQNSDINTDGTYPSFRDINPFVLLLSRGGR